MKKRLLSMLTSSLALLLALAPIASTPASNGTYQAEERAVAAGRDLTDAAHMATGDLYTALLAKDAGLYQNAMDSKAAINLKKGDALLVHYDGLHDDGQTTGSIGVLYDNVVYYAREKDFAPKEEDSPLYTRLFASDIAYFARATKDIPVYRLGTDGKRESIGRIPKDANFAARVERVSGGYIAVQYGDAIGYIRANRKDHARINREKWEAKLERGGGMARIGDWDYGGLLAQKRESMEPSRVISLSVTLSNGAVISEVYSSDAEAANGRAKSLMERNELLISQTSDEEVYESFDIGANYRFYRNENAIIYYGGTDESTIAALEKTHGQPFYTLKG